MSHTSPTRLRAELLEDRLAPAQAGNLDPSFGSGGVATLPAALASNTFTAVDMAAGPDGSSRTLNGVYVPAMIKKMLAWSIRFSTAWVRSLHVPRW